MRAPKTPSSGAALEQKSARRYSTGALSNTKPASNLLPTKINASAKTAAQRKLEMDHQEREKNVRSMKNSLRPPQQPLYHSPARNKPDLAGHIIRGDAPKVSSDEVEKVPTQKVASSNKISEVGTKFSQMTISSSAQLKRRQLDKPPPPAMKAGVWHTQTEYLGRSYEIPSVHPCSRRVVCRERESTFESLQNDA